MREKNRNVSDSKNLDRIECYRSNSLSIIFCISLQQHIMLYRKRHINLPLLHTKEARERKRREKLSIESTNFGSISDLLWIFLYGYVKNRNNRLNQYH